jgi:hypothetical protein
MVIYVNRRATGLNNGSSWRNAYNDLQSALRSAKPGAVIYIAGNATYTPTIGINRSESFVIPSGVRIFGGFSGNENQPRNITQYPTILSGNIGRSYNNDNSYNVVTLDNVSDVYIDGITVTLGNANSRSSNIYLRTKESSGGGIYIRRSKNVTIRNSEIKNNAAVSGGGIANLESENIRISNSKFTNNNAIAYSGGAIMNQLSNIVIDVSQFNNNQAYMHGGAINSYDSQIIVTQSSFEQNKTISPHGDGGALEIEINAYTKNPNSPSLLNKVKFIRNTSGDDGGAIEISDGVKVFGNQLYFQDNQSGSLGSAILVEQASSTIVNSYFNTNDQGPQYYITHGLPSRSNYTNLLINSTILNGELENSNITLNATKGIIGLYNNIIWNQNSTNDRSSIEVIRNSNPRSILVSNNIVRGGYPGINWNIDPNLNFNYFTLQGNSPAINRGNNQVYLNTFEQVKNYPSIFNKSQDIQGRQRIVGGAIDLGASESSLNQTITQSLVQGNTISNNTYAWNTGATEMINVIGGENESINPNPVGLAVVPSSTI